MSAHDWRTMSPTKREALSRLAHGMRVPVVLMGVTGYPRWRRIIERWRYRW